MRFGGKVHWKVTHNRLLPLTRQKLLLGSDFRKIKQKMHDFAYDKNSVNHDQQALPLEEA